MVEQKKEKVVDKVIDLIFSKDNRKYVILFLVLGFILRLLISLRTSFGADEIAYAAHSIGFIESGKLQIMDQDAIWFFLTDFFMKILGVNVLGLRFLAVLLGSLSIVLVYFLGKEIFNKRVALIASFILAVSSYHILFSIGQMDVPMAFFALLGMYFLILFLKTDKKSFFVLAWVSLGIAIMVKQIALLFIPAFVLFSLFYNKKHKGNFKISQIFYAALIIILVVVPVLTHNYLLYKDKGLVDMQFSRFFGIAEEQYASIAHTLNPFSLKTLLISYEGGVPGLLVALKMIYSFESIFILLFSILGILVIANSKRNFKWLLFLSFLFPFLFLIGSALLPNHFAFTALFFSLFAAKGIDFFACKFKKPESQKRILCFILVLVVISSAIQINQYNSGFFGKNEITKLIDFKKKSIEEDSVVIVDSRIYRGRIAFMFSDRHYVETMYFSNLVAMSDMFQEELIPYKTYFVEAVTDDSGWGNVKDNPEFNQSTEEVVAIFNSGELVTIINDIQGQPHFAVYQGYFNLPQNIFGEIDSTHSFYYYPLGLKPRDQVFDNYGTYSIADNLLDKFAHLILYLEIIITILFLLLLIYLFYKDVES